jgi:hypothetical protein
MRNFRWTLGSFKPFALSFVFLGAVFVWVLAVPNVTYASTRDHAAGTLELAGGDWLSGSGVDIFSNGNSAANTWGNSCVPVSGAAATTHCSAGNVWAGDKWQCVEMINRLYLTKGWTSATWFGNGNTLKDNLPDGLTAQNNGAVSSLSAGDVITLNDGGDGHAGIINSVGSTIQIVNQNTIEVNSSASITAGSLSNGNASLGMSGWAGYSVQSIIHHPSGSASSSSSTVAKPAAISFNSALNVFIRGGDGYIYAQYWNGTSWSGYTAIGGGMAGDPALIVNSGALSVFARGNDNQIYTKYNNGSGWTGWASLGAQQMRGNPRVVQYGSEVDVFALGTDNHPYKNTWQSTSGWGGWTSLGNYMDSSPAPVVNGSNLSVVMRGGDNQVYVDTWNGTGWSGFGSIGGTVSGNPDAISYGGMLSVLTNVPNANHIYMNTWNGTNWGGWADHGGVFNGDVDAMQYNNDLEFFVRGTDGNVYTRWWSASGQTWGGWNSIGGGNIVGDPTAVQYGTELDVFVMGSDGKTYKNTYNPSSNWGGFTALPL